MTAHTPEPWNAMGDTIYPACGGAAILRAVPREGQEPDFGLMDANAKRAALCVSMMNGLEPCAMRAVVETMRGLLHDWDIAHSGVFVPPGTIEWRVNGLRVAYRALTTLPMPNLDS